MAMMLVGLVGSLVWREVPMRRASSSRPLPAEPPPPEPATRAVEPRAGAKHPG
jgi:hypothetical protein